MTDNTLLKLEKILQQRKQAQPSDSYVASLYDKGLDAILKKIGEEATELVIAAKSKDKEQIIYEMADLWFHTMVLLAQQNIKIDDMMTELNRRFGLSGLKEKANRVKHQHRRK